MYPGSANWYIAQFWLDTLFDTNYGDGSRDITHYLTDARVEALEHNRNITAKIKEVVENEMKGTISSTEGDALISKLCEQRIEIP